MPAGTRREPGAAGAWPGPCAAGPPGERKHASMDINLCADLIPEQSVRVSPRLVAASYILELSSLELQQVIQQELDENPAIELLEAPTCPACGGAVQGRICPHCLTQQPEAKNTEAETETSE